MIVSWGIFNLFNNSITSFLGLHGKIAKESPGENDNEELISNEYNLTSCCQSSAESLLLQSNLLKYGFWKL